MSKKMRIVIQAFSDGADTKDVEWRGDTVAEVESFKEAHKAIDDMEKNGI